MGASSALLPASSDLREPTPVVWNTVLLLGIVLAGVVMAATGTMSVYLVAILAVAAVVGVAGLVPMVDYDGPAPALVGGYVVAVLALVVI